MDCTLCPALCGTRIQVVNPSPCPAGGLLAIGEAPGRHEDEIGSGFVGPAGKTLDKVLAEFGLARNDYGRANICRCRPPGNRRPLNTEIDACIPRLVDSINTMQPRVLLLVGATAVVPFLGKGSLLSLIEKSREPGCATINRRECHPTALLLDRRHIHVVPMPHTSGLAWNRTAPNGVRWGEVGRQQIALALALLRDS